MKNNTLFAMLGLSIFMLATSCQNNETTLANAENESNVVQAGLAMNVATSNDRIQWMSWDEVQKAMEKEPRKVFIDIYTDWCGWCRRMDQNTFQLAYIARYMNKNYYNIKFNAEQKESIVFQGKEFKFVASGKRGYHELAGQLTQGRLSYPTIVFMDEQFRLIQPIPGYQAPENFEPIMTFFAEAHYLETPWEQYKATFKPMDRN